MTDEEDGDHFFVTDKTTTLIDVISFDNLVIGKEYTITGTLYDKQTEEAITDENGDPITSYTSFVPASTSGEVEVAFEFDSYLFNQGDTIVAFESLYRGGRELAVHADINDDGQSVTALNPSIMTYATDAFDGDKYVVTTYDASIVDEVSYSNFSIDGEPYTIYGMLFDQQTGLPFLTGDNAEDISEDELEEFLNELLDAAGLPMVLTANSDPSQIDNDSEQTVEDEAITQERMLSEKELDEDAILEVMNKYADVYEACVTSTVEVYPTASSSNVEMTYDFDATDLVGKTVTVMTIAVKDGYLAAAHLDLSDESTQSVEVITSRIGTTLIDPEDGDHEVDASMETTLNDEVSYENLLPGKQYTLTGVMMDKQTGEQLLINGQTVESSKSFTPTESDGIEEIEFCLDTSLLEDGTELVAFEYLYYEESEEPTATHTDIEDSGQTVKVSNSSEEVVES
ncbi:MAG: VaFE repeat-containing surface-anchored protein, partial [Eggerthellaceae bacterium]|nr:VaFE repeat-containing surface-anchored protein [Eggerthellaceae bacterium]